MGIIRSAIIQWIIFNGGKVDKSNESVTYFVPLNRIDKFFMYLRECLSFEDTNMFACKIQDGYMVIPRQSLEQNIAA